MDGYLPIGDRVRELRRRRGLSQLRFGALIDRSENWVSKAERGEIPIDRLSVSAITEFPTCRVLTIT